MISRKLCLLFTILCISLLIGCVSSWPNKDNIPLPTQSNTVVTQVSITNTPTSHLTSVAPATILPTVATTPVLLSTGTPPISTNLALMCDKTELESVEGFVTGLNGILAYVVPANTRWERGEGQSGIIGGTPLQSRQFPPVSNIDVIGFSPDGKWFAYAKPLDQPGRSEPFVYLLSDEGQTIITLMPEKAENETLFWFATWISNDLIMIQYNKISTNNGGTYVVDSYAIIDAFTGEDHNELLENLIYWDSWTTPYFSSDMTRVVYVTDSRSPLGTSLVLWDTEHQTILWSKSFHSIFGVEEDYIGSRGFNQTVFWAPDNSSFIFTTGESVSENKPNYSSYLVDREGITEHLLVSSPNFSDVMVLGGIWSPDGRFIYYFHGNSFIYDLALNQIIELCANYSTYVAWSPNSSYFAYVGRENQEPYLLIFNIYTGEISNVGALDDVVGLDWLANEDWLNAPNQ